MFNENRDLSAKFSGEARILIPESRHTVFINDEELGRDVFLVEEHLELQAKVRTLEARLKVLEARLNADA